MEWSYSIILIVALCILSGCSQTSDSSMSPAKSQAQNVTTSPAVKEQPTDAAALSTPKGNETAVVPSKKPVQKDSSNPSLPPEKKKTESIPDKKESKQAITNANKTGLSEKTLDASNTGFSKDEIEKAKLVAKEYYKGTVLIVDSIELVNRNTVYDNYSSKYEKENIITFSIKIKNSENPPRGIVLIRQDSSSNWKVLDEGY